MNILHFSHLTADITEKSKMKLAFVFQLLQFLCFCYSLFVNMYLVRVRPATAVKTNEQKVPPSARVKFDSPTSARPTHTFFACHTNYVSLRLVKSNSTEDETCII